MNVFAAAGEAWRAGRRSAFATVIGVGGSAPRAAGARMLIHADGSTIGTIGGGAFEHRVVRQALEVIAAGRPRRFSADLRTDLGMCCGGRMEVFIEPLQSREPFTMFGAGHVAHALAPLLVALDFAVTVVDDRPEWNTAARFPGCTTHTGDPLTLAQDMETHDRTWILVVTHDHRLDQDLLRELIERETAWLGMIGSQAKVARFLKRLRAAGVDVEALRRLRAPVGLDLGAETPAEIAVSIAAELVQRRRHCERHALPLSSRPLPQRAISSGTDPESSSSGG